MFSQAHFSSMNCIIRRYPQYLLATARCGSSPHAWGLRGRIRRQRLESAVHPHMRGAYVVDHGLPDFLRRFIPTCVGLTLRGAGSALRSPVHPHMRGAYLLIVNQSMLMHGSSPHAWGLLEPLLTGTFKHRFIPTCVGLTTMAFRTHLVLSVHPHMRGAYQPGQRLCE